MHVVCVAVVDASRLAIWSETRMAHCPVGARKLVGSTGMSLAGTSGSDRSLPENSSDRRMPWKPVTDRVLRQKSGRTASM